jgi:hypothetical protein
MRSRSAQVATAIALALALAGLFCLICGCADDQARSAANIRVLTLRTAQAGPLNADQGSLQEGILSEADAIRLSTAAEATPTIGPEMTHAQAGAEAKAHAQTVRTIPAQVANSVWTWALGAAGTAATLLLGGATWKVVAQQGAAGLLRTAVQYGNAMADALKRANPPVAAAVTEEQVAIQEARGHRQGLRAVRDEVRAATMGKSLMDELAQERQARKDAEERLAVTEQAAHRLSAEHRRLWAQMQASEGGSALEPKPVQPA